MARFATVHSAQGLICFNRGRDLGARPLLVISGPMHCSNDYPGAQQPFLTPALIAPAGAMSRAG